MVKEEVGESGGGEKQSRAPTNAKHCTVDKEIKRI